MKLKVVRPFHDKETDELYTVGSVIDVTEKRAKEILASRYDLAEPVEPVEQETTVTEEPTVTVEGEEAPKKRSKKK